MVECVFYYFFDRLDVTHLSNHMSGEKREHRSHWGSLDSVQLEFSTTLPRSLYLARKVIGLTNWSLKIVLNFFFIHFWFCKIVLYLWMLYLPEFLLLLFCPWKGHWLTIKLLLKITSSSLSKSHSCTYLCDLHRHSLRFIIFIQGHFSSFFFFRILFFFKKKENLKMDSSFLRLMILCLIISIFWFKETLCLATSIHDPQTISHHQDQKTLNRYRNFARRSLSSSNSTQQTPLQNWQVQEVRLFVLHLSFF